MFKNVLVGIDGKSGGRDAIALASRLVDPAAALTLAHVDARQPHPGRAVAPGAGAQERDASERLLAQEAAAAELKADLIGVAASSPGRGLHQQAETQDADLLVVGSSARGAFGRVLLGDDTRAALNGAPCAVAIAVVAYAEHPTPLAKIGVGYDGSPESKAALAVARELAAASRGSVHAMQVVSLPTYGYTGVMSAGIGSAIEPMLDEARDELERLPEVEGHAVYGIAGEELAAFGDELDLLVVGSRGLGPVKRVVLSSTSEYLERHARCSLLVLRRVATGEGGAGQASERQADASSAAA
jgi:nucleotide-binding universal stress UspA family protein